MKTLSVITMSALAVLAVSSLAPLAFAATPNHPLAKAGKGAWTSFSDGFGNGYTAHRIKHVNLYTLSGQLESNTYLLTLPWSLRALT